MTGRSFDDRGQEREEPEEALALSVRQIAFVEDCLEGSSIREIRLAGMLDDAAVLRPATLGDIECHQEFPRPIFRVRLPGGGYRKGIGAAESFRAFFPRWSRTSRVCGADRISADSRKPHEVRVDRRYPYLPCRARRGTPDRRRRPDNSAAHRERASIGGGASPGNRRWVAG